MQDQELHTEAAADAQTDEAYTLPREVVGHRRHPVPPNLYQYERRVLLQVRQAAWHNTWQYITRC